MIELAEAIDFAGFLFDPAVIFGLFVGLWALGFVAGVVAGLVGGSGRSHG